MSIYIKHISCTKGKHQTVFEWSKMVIDLEKYKNMQDFEFIYNYAKDNDIQGIFRTVELHLKLHLHLVWKLLTKVLKAVKMKLFTSQTRHR